MVTLLITVLRDRPAMKPVRPARAPLESPNMSIGAFTAAEVMIDDAAELPRHHAVHRRLDQFRSASACWRRSP
jgi:hypothetical protein